ncbi:hypothetical protein R8Z50_35355 [Longispora sp. K20-0274]|uniref:hypothetical protein n=1 Tax=Longispora sp. K20-0274 TaxID=3088255 RepID=UPI00399BEF4A
MTDVFSEQLIVQLPMGLSQDDLGIRHRLEDTIEVALTGVAVGLVDGGDIGSGTMNVFALVDPARWDEAVTAVRSLLDDANLSEVAVIARRDCTDEESEPRIVWPEGSVQEFQY